MDDEEGLFDDEEELLDEKAFASLVADGDRVEVSLWQGLCPPFLSQGWPSLNFIHALSGLSMSTQIDESEIDNLLN